jgi:predicted component of type VI protein secretion system
VIIDPRASRQHARIERRPEGFVLIDQSTNGTFVAEEGAAERCIKHGEAVLTGPGRIACGFSANEVERDRGFVEIV